MAFVDTLIRKYKSRKKNAFLNQAIYQTRKQYAFVGVGMHSLANLYPILHVFNIRLKYIYSDTASVASALSARFPGSRAATGPEEIARDPEVAGVFICTTPGLHFKTASMMLDAGKHVYLEKPPCQSLAELQTLVEKRRNLNCFIGLQKRFCTANRILSAKIKHTRHYHCRYLLGAYLEGNPVYDLFIHPVDNCIRLFGKANVQFMKESGSGGSREHLVILEHANTTGVIELSTGYSWNSPTDSLVVNTNKELLTIRYPNFVQGEEKSLGLIGVSLEKIGNHHPVTKTYLSVDGVIPAMENGNLYVQGFFGAVSAFLRSVENNATDPQYQPETLLNTYEILDGLSTRK